MPSEVMHTESAGVEADVRQMLVLWQHPETREILPVGRVSHEGDHYSFEYTRAAAEVPGFRPLPGLGPIGRRTIVASMPAILRMRVMDAERPDYARYIATLGLTDQTATPWEQILRSGGERQGDTLQFMQVPVEDAGRARARFLASGVRHVPHNDLIINGVSRSVTESVHEQALASLAPGTPVELLPQDNNEYDVCATLATSSNVPLGWVPRVLSSSVRELLGHGPVVATVVRVNGPGSPAHLRLVLDLDVPAPEGFEFDRAGRWSPA